MLSPLGRKGPLTYRGSSNSGAIHSTTFISLFESTLKPNHIFRPHSLLSLHTSVESITSSTADSMWRSEPQGLIYLKEGSTHLTVAVAIDNGHKETLKEKEKLRSEQKSTNFNQSVKVIPSENRSDNNLSASESKSGQTSPWPRLSVSVLCFCWCLCVFRRIWLLKERSCQTIWSSQRFNEQSVSELRKAAGLITSLLKFHRPSRSNWSIFLIRL